MADGDHKVERRIAPSDPSRKDTRSAPLKGSDPLYPKGVKELSRRSAPPRIKVELAIQELDKRLSNPADDETPPAIFNQWSVEQAESEYPDIGSRAYAVPDHFTGSHKTELYGRGSMKDPKRFVPLKTAEQHSQFRGDNAQRFVGRAFRVSMTKGLSVEMLNCRMEEERHPTMFIISQPHYDNLLVLLRQKLKGDWKSLEHRYRKIKALMSEKEQKEVAKREGCRLSGDFGGKLKKAEAQLERDTKIFRCLMSKSSANSEEGSRSSDQGSRSHVEEETECPVPVTSVIALPNLTRVDLKDAEVERQEGITYLLKEDLFEDDISVSESETDLSSFRSWWNRLPTQSPPMELTLMKEIVGKYIGPLSSALTCKGGNERERLRHFRDCVHHTGCLLKRPQLNARQRQILEDTKADGRVYLSGPPGSGKTLLLEAKAIEFLQSSRKTHVIVLNMYRGAKGRAIGRRIFDEVKAAFIDDPAQGRVHMISVDVCEDTFDKQQFVKHVEDVLKDKAEDLYKVKEERGKDGKAEDDCKEEVEDTDKELGLLRGLIKGLDFKDTREDSFKDKGVLFLVDEIYVDSFWQGILDSFKNEFSDSLVWCAGLFSNVPEGFQEHALQTVLRCPPSVQNLLYHVDWKPERREQYVRDTVQPEVPTNGPVPLCIRHERHEQVSVIDCVRCAEQLARLLKSERILSVASGEGEEMTAAPVPDDPCSICYADLKVAVLVNLPRRLYKKTGMYINTSHSRYKKYMADIENCPFVQTLESEGISVSVKTELACKDLGTDQQESCVATWLYNFQGLEMDVVVFLPGDSSASDGQQDEQEPSRDIPAPGLQTADFEQDVSSIPAVSCPSSGEHDSPHCSPSASESTLEVPNSTEKLNISQSAVSSSEPAGKPACRERSDCSHEKDKISSYTTDSSTESLESKLSDEKGSVKPKRPGISVSKNPESSSTGSSISSCSPLTSTSSNVNCSLTSMQWKKRDIERYSPWDKTNLMVAGSRTLSLLILIVP